MNQETNWGYEAILLDRKEYSTKIMVLKEGESLPYIYHKKRDKSWILLQGVLQINIEGGIKLLNEGETQHISPGLMHTATAIKGDATIIEVGTQLLDDAVIVGDKYQNR